MHGVNNVHQYSEENYVKLMLVHHLILCLIDRPKYYIDRVLLQSNVQTLS